MNQQLEIDIADPVCLCGFIETCITKQRQPPGIAMIGYGESIIRRNL